MLAGAIALILCVCLSALGAASASAVQSHVFSSSFNGGSGHELSDPQGLAINQSTGKVYVVDQGHDRVEVFEASGSFVSSFGKEGAGNGEFKQPTDIAVANGAGACHGDVYVVDGGVVGGANRIEIFNEKGEYKSQLTRTEIESVLVNKTKNKAKFFERVYGVAVDGSCNLWLMVSETEGAGVGKPWVLEKLPAGGVIERTGNVQKSVERGFAIDPNEDLLIVVQGGAGLFEGSGEEVAGTKVGLNGTPTPTAVAANPADGTDLYIDRGTAISRYNDTTHALLETFGASGPGALSAGVGIAVNSAGAVYAADSASNLVDVYELQTQEGAPSEVETGSAQEVGSSGAKLGGKLNPNGGSTHYYVEYGESACDEVAETCGTKTAEGGPLSGETQQTVTPIAVTGLKPGTTYHYWLVAVNNAGKTHGKPAELKTTLEVSLTVARYGNGTVISTPAGIDCGTGAGCTASFAPGTVTLTEEPQAGYEFAGWIGCKRIAETSSCEVLVSGATEVGAVFLKAGKEGLKGLEGLEGLEGPEGRRGAAGATGATGPQGPAGPAGAQGEKGAQGVQGPAGARGPAGAAGMVELVTCRKVKRVNHCTTKLVSGTVKFTTSAFATRALLSRRGVVYADGTARSSRSGLRLRLAPLRRLRPGRYTLTLISGSGLTERIQHEQFTLGAGRATTTHHAK